METITTPKTGAFLADWTAEYERDPDNTFHPGLCAECGCSLGEPHEWVHTLKVCNIEIPRPVRYCDPCIEKIIAARKAEDRLRRDAAFAKIIPVEFNYWDRQKGNAALLERVTQLYPDPDGPGPATPRGNFAARRGCLIHGTTGSCKTRIAWQIIKRLVCHSEAFLLGLL